jgi:hypothetical protein
VVFKHRAFDPNICAFVLPVSEFMATCIGLLFLVCQSVTDFQRKRSLSIQESLTPCQSKNIALW